jgi:hypothetical protein
MREKHSNEEVFPELGEDCSSNAAETAYVLAAMTSPKGALSMGMFFS